MRTVVGSHRRRFRGQYTDQKIEQVGLGDDAHKLALGDHRQTADLMIAHEPSRIGDRSIRFDRKEG